jgi:hypothetical protein
MGAGGLGHGRDPTRTIPVEAVEGDPVGWPHWP